jgi:EAL domain-containing protein (putative c-di-GMP-specific phosphodiesterase class I)
MGLELEAVTLMAGLAGARGLPSGAWLSLNVSPAMVVDGHHLAHLIANRTRPIVLEITEHELIDDYRNLRFALAALGRDVRIAVDDAGAGIANFAHLVELRPEFVKLDQHLVRGINADVSRQAMVVALQHFARSSSSWVIAEGIETEAELATLRELGLRYGQGYLLGRPAPAEAWAAPEGR